MGTIAKGLSRARAHSSNVRPIEGAAVSDLALVDIPAPLEIDDLQRVKLHSEVLERNRVVTSGVARASAAYKMLRTRVLQRMRRNGWKTIAVTGTRPDEGKTLTAINLSISLARDVGTSVLLVDMDLRKPSVHRYLGISPRYGIGDFLRGSVTLSEAAVRPGVDRLGVLLNDRPFQNSSEMLTSPQTAELVSQAKEGEGRIVVFDLPPILASDDMLAFCPMVDCVLLVLAQGITRHADMIAARDLMQSVNIVGAVLNQSSEDVAPYYYYGSR